MAIISMIHATRGRPQDAAQVFPSWSRLSSGKHPLEYVVSLDHDDQASRGITWPVGTKLVKGPAKGSVGAYNRGLYVSSGEVVVQVMDDLEPPAHWDRIIVDRLGDLTQPKLLHVSDGTGNNPHKPYLLTVLIGTRAYFKRCGYMYHPDYIHCFGDDDHSIKASLERCVIDAPEIVFSHQWRGSDHDATARFAYARETQLVGIQVLARRCLQGFPNQPQLWV